jgi:hypothetical protein
MGFKIENNYKVTIFGRQFTSLQHLAILFVYTFFLAIPWPLISSSYFFVPVAVTMVPIVLPEFIYNEIYSGVKLFKILMYGGIFIATFIYTRLFLGTSFFMSIIHFSIYATYGYVYSSRLN